MSIKEGNNRIIITMDKEHLKKIDAICDLLKTKQKSKAINFLIDYFYQTKKD